MKRTILIGLTCLTLAGVLTGPAQAQRNRGNRQEATPENIDKAIRKMVQFIWSKQNQRTGLWPGYKIEEDGQRLTEESGHNTHPWGPSALAVYALLAAGDEYNKPTPDAEAAPLMRDPRMQKALKALAKPDSIMTYTLGLRANVWLQAFRLAPRSERPYYRKLLLRDAEKLFKSTEDGSYGYKSLGEQKSSGDNSNAQYGLLGVWAASLAEAGVEIPEAYWHLVMKHWLLTQRGDGGWNYRAGDSKPSRDTMTAAGVASLFVCFDSLYEEAFISCNVPTEFLAIQRGLDWFDRNFSTGGHGTDGYLFYGIERVGLASGYKYFGAVDWYKAGARSVINSMDGDGSVGGGSHGGSHADGLVNTAFCLLFMIRGQHPVLFNKLRFEGDWNNRPRDLANFTRWVRNTSEDVVNWQIINLQVPVEEWHDAPIVYISGSKQPRFTDEDIEKLRTFVLQGGTIFSVSECGGRAGFRMGIRQVYAKMFPQYELVSVGPRHELRNKPNKLPARMDLSMLSNGIRPLAIHTDEDLPVSWQARRTETKKVDFQAGYNVYLYITGKRLRNRGEWEWPEMPEELPETSVKVVRVEHTGNWNPEPLALERLRRLMASHENLLLEIAEPVKLKELGQSDARIAVLTGSNEASFNQAQADALKAFVKGGGTVIVDAAGGSLDFYRAAEDLIRKAAFETPLQNVARGDDFANIPGHEIGDKLKLRTGNQGFGVLRKLPIFTDQGARMGILLSRADITAGLVGFESSSIKGFRPNPKLEEDSPYLLMRNLILNVTGPIAQPQDQ